jgi:hypothetical protein
MDKCKNTGGRCVKEGWCYCGEEQTATDIPRGQADSPTPVTEERLDKLDGLFAYDHGFTDSGRRDDRFRQWLADNPEETGKLLTELARRWLTAGQGHTFEDIAELVHWAGNELRIDCRAKNDAKPDVGFIGGLGEGW